MAQGIKGDEDVERERVSQGMAPEYGGSPFYSHPPPLNPRSNPNPDLRRGLLQSLKGRASTLKKY